MAKIQFISFAPVFERDGQVDSDMASARYRVIIPAMQLDALGHAVMIDTIPADPALTMDPAALDADVVVFSKSFNVNNEALAMGLRQRGIRVVFDLCDNLFEHVIHGTKYREHAINMCRIADVIVTSTTHLAELVRKQCGLLAEVITDPLEGPHGQAHFMPKFPRAKLLWFGHQSNWSSLASVLPSLAELAQSLPMSLQVITTPMNQIQSAVNQFTSRHAGRLPTVLTPWSKAAVWSALADCDMVIIPSLQSDFHSAKSPNRLTESLRAGRHVVAHALPSYQEFAEYVCLDQDIAAGVAASLQIPELIVGRVQRGQSHVEQRYAAEVIGAQWHDVLTAAGTALDDTRKTA